MGVILFLVMQYHPTSEDENLQILQSLVAVQCTHPRIDRFPFALQPSIQVNLRDAFTRTEEWYYSALEAFEEEKPRIHWEYTENWFVSARSERVVSLMGFARYHSGGVHPNSSMLGRTVWLDGETLKVARLADLFNPCSAWMEELSVRVLHKLRAAGASDVLDETLTALDERGLDTWGLTREGIEFLFAPYRVGCYAEGSYFALVPYEEIREILNPLGPAAEFR